MTIQAVAHRLATAGAAHAACQVNMTSGPKPLGILIQNLHSTRALDDQNSFKFEKYQVRRHELDHFRLKSFLI